jgi:excisionase family DNA binding protein
MSKMPVPKEWMTTDDLSEMFSCSRTTVWRWVKSGALPKPHRLGGLNRWRRADIEALTADTSAA